MTRFALTTLLAALAATTIQGSAIPSSSHTKRQKEIPHDSVKAFAQDVGSGVSADLYKKYKPFLKVTDGCVPFPAVNSKGETNAGLDDTGRMDGLCSSSEGQVYSRAGSVDGRFAIMYAWYFPKDMNVDYASVGHRNDWEEIVVFLDAEKADAKLLGISYSGHGKYPDKITKARLERDNFLDGSRPKVNYWRPEGRSHRVTATSQKGGEQPLINYSQLTEAARKGLAKTNWNAAVCPFCDTGEFDRKIDAAWSGDYK